jgi:hypothetical protein
MDSGILFTSWIEIVLPGLELWHDPYNSAQDQRGEQRREIARQARKENGLLNQLPRSAIDVWRDDPKPAVPFMTPPFRLPAQKDGASTIHFQ